MVRARDLGCIDEMEFVRGMKRMSAARLRLREPIEVGPMLLQTALAPLGAAGTSAQDLADILGLRLRVHAHGQTAGE
jgi:hypothetical protein